jgi:hypothetical protein
MEKSRTDPKGLWKILNNIDKKKSDVSNNVTLELLNISRI